MTRPVHPDFVFAGAARSGSTAVIESLRRRPDVFVTEPKEPHYLALAGSPPRFTGPGDDLTINTRSVVEPEAYARLFTSAPAGSLTGEGSVSTLYYAEQAAERLRSLNPEARVVIVLREPVSRAYSSHQYLLNRGFETVPEFLDALALEPERVAAGWHHLWHYEGMSRYADDVEVLLQAFPATTRVWWYDDLMRDEEATLAEIHAFLGLPARDEPLSVGRVNASGSPRRQWVQSSMHLASRSAALRTVVKAVVPFEARERLRRSNLAVNDVPDDVARVVAPRFSSDLDRLEQVLGRPVPAGWRGR